VNIMRFALLLFIVMPIVEMWLLITVGGHIGAMNTIFLVMLTALVGIGLLKRQGFATLWRGQEKLQQGQVPAQEMIEGIVLAVSGALLLTPGFVTDVIGFLGLLPFTRILAVKAMLSKFSMVNASAANFSQTFHSRPENTGDTIDGEAWESEQSLKKPK
jgi:UPF0716 protein FxsA